MGGFGELRRRAHAPILTALGAVSLLIMVGGVLTTAVKAQQQEVRVHLSRTLIDGPVRSLAPVGTTSCNKDGEIVVTVNSTVDTSKMTPVLMHEFVHVHQILNYGNGDCRTFMLRYRTDAAFRYAQEVQAYCIDVALWATTENDRLVSMDDLVLHLWAHNRLGKSYAAFKRRVFKDCSKPDLALVPLLKEEVQESYQTIMRALRTPTP